MAVVDYLQSVIHFRKEVEEFANDDINAYLKTIPDEDMAVDMSKINRSAFALISKEAFSDMYAKNNPELKKFCDNISKEELALYLKYDQEEKEFIDKNPLSWKLIKSDAAYSWPDNLTMLSYPVTPNNIIFKRKKEEKYENSAEVFRGGLLSNAIKNSPKPYKSFITFKDDGTSNTLVLFFPYKITIVMHPLGYMNLQGYYYAPLNYLSPIVDELLTKRCEIFL